MRKFIYLLMFCFIGCNKVEPENFVLKNKIEGLMLSMKNNTKDTLILNIKDMTDFQWENLYIFRHFDYKSTIIRKLGHDWKGIRDMPENSLMFVFTRGYNSDKKVVSYMFFDGNEMKMEKNIKLNAILPSPYDGFTHETASFVIEKNLDGNRLGITIYVNDGTTLESLRRNI